jgi:hypothetical protein
MFDSEQKAFKIRGYAVQAPCKQFPETHAMGPLSSQMPLKFPHRKNRDGTYDSICPGCLVTVATCKSEADLLTHERKHVCDESRIVHFGNLPEKAKQSDHR